MLGQLARRVKILASRAQALYSFIVALGNLFFKVLVMANSEGILKKLLKIILNIGTVLVIKYQII